MKGIILAGGTGSRLAPLTAVVNKHLLPVGKYPMVYFPLGTLVDAGISDIMVVTGGNNAGKFLELLGSGSAFGLKGLSYGYQDKPGGIADALRVARDFVGNDRMVVILGDNILCGSIKDTVDRFDGRERGAQIFLYEVDNPEEYGVAELNLDQSVRRIIEKPADPPSNWAVIGVYMYDYTVWDLIEKLEPSARGELEISEVNQYYANRGILFADKYEGAWADAGESHFALMEAGRLAWEHAPLRDVVVHEET